MLETTPIAFVLGEPIVDLPQDLYIPPQALRVFLESFNGPLDLLYYLIKKQNINILDIPIAKITAQYVEYIELMQQLHLDLAAEYLVMAATLAEIKSRMLLPRPVLEEDEEDPRAELVRRLKEYERFKIAAELLDQLPRVQRDIFLTSVDSPVITQEKPLPQIDLTELIAAFNEIMQRAELLSQHQIQRENLSVRERMAHILTTLQTAKFIEFNQLFTFKEGRQGVVVSLIAILELLRQSMIEMVQVEPFSQIYLKIIE